MNEMRKRSGSPIDERKRSDLEAEEDVDENDDDAEEEEDDVWPDYPTWGLDRKRKRGLGSIV
jgi:hypothetical protein